MTTPTRTTGRYAAATLFVGLILALGCAGKKQDDADDTSSVGDSGTSPETPPINWSGSCPSATGIGTSTRWEYEYNEAFEESSSLSGTYSVEVTGVGEDGTLTLVTEVETQGSNNSFESTTTETFGCDDEGLKLLDTYYEYVVTVYESYEGYQDYTWNTPVLLVPTSVEVGDSWESVYDGVYEDELGARRAQDYTVVTEVTGREEVTVPAGTYTAMVWVSDSSLSVPVTNYVANGTGKVATPEADLVSFTP